MSRNEHSQAHRSGELQLPTKDCGTISVSVIVCNKTRKMRKNRWVSLGRILPNVNSFLASEWSEWGSIPLPKTYKQSVALFVRSSRCPAWVQGLVARTTKTAGFFATNLHVSPKPSGALLKVYPLIRKIRGQFCHRTAWHSLNSPGDHMKEIGTDARIPFQASAWMNAADVRALIRIRTLTWCGCTSAPHTRWRGIPHNESSQQ
jgi:hypothetical protein